MTVHEQVWIKVNASVDRNISELIEALSLFPCLETIESCEGDGEAGAWACFRYGAEGAWDELAKFVLGCLGPFLMEEVGDSAVLMICATAYGGPRAEITVRPGRIHEVSKAIAALRARG